MGLLLDQITGDNAHLQQLLAAQKILRQESEKWKALLAVRQGDVLPAREQKVADYLQFLKAGLAKYTRKLCSNEEEASLPCFSYKRFRKQSGIHYEYPESEGFLLLWAEAVLWGRNHTGFVWAGGKTRKTSK